MRAAFLMGDDDDLVLIRVASAAQKQADAGGPAAHAATYEGSGRHGTTLQSGDVAAATVAAMAFTEMRPSDSSK